MSSPELKGGHIAFIKFLGGAFILLIIAWKNDLVARSATSTVLNPAATMEYRDLPKNTVGINTSTGTMTDTKKGMTSGKANANTVIQAYSSSKPITLRSNSTISGLSIDLGNSSAIGISGNGVSNVHITNCRIVNTTSFAINLYNCSNITIDNCFISNVGFGIYAQGKSSTIKVNNNQFLNINGVNTGFLGHAVQFAGVSGGGNQINHNRIENIAGVALHPHDLINVFKSNGLPGDSIQVIGNWIRGGQLSLWPTKYSGAAGIVLGDLGGSYQVARNNILVNPGFIGMQAQGGSHIKMDHNKIYSISTPASGGGMSWGNYTGLPASDVIYAYNEVKFYNAQGKEYDYNTNSPGLTMVNNSWGADIDAAILPTVIITLK